MTPECRCSFHAGPPGVSIVIVQLGLEPQPRHLLPTCGDAQVPTCCDGQQGTAHKSCSVKGGTHAGLQDQACNVSSIMTLFPNRLSTQPPLRSSGRRCRRWRRRCTEGWRSRWRWPRTACTTPPRRRSTSATCWGPCAASCTAWQVHVRPAVDGAPSLRHGLNATASLGFGMQFEGPPAARCW